MPAPLPRARGPRHRVQQHVLMWRVPMWRVWALTAAFACAPAAPSPHVPQAEFPGVARHASQSQQLSLRMRELQQLSHDQLGRVQGGIQHPRDREALADVARSLSESAAQIPAAMEDLSLEPAEREEFAFLAEVLARRALAVATEAPYGSVDALHQRSLEVQQTCNHCHGRFRIPLVPAAEDSGGATAVTPRD